MAVLLLVFIIYPFGAFLLALTQTKRRSSYVIYALWGLVFVWHMNPTSAERYDDLRGILDRINGFNLTFNELSDQFIAMITFAPNAPKEWFESFMIWLSKNITANPHFYFVLCAIPWLFFELSSLNRITSDPKFRQSFICIVILLLFVIPRDIISLQNPRFTTATWCAIYSTLGYFSSKKHKTIYLLLIFLTPLIHSAFWFYIIVFVAGLVMYHFPKLSVTLLYASVPFSFLSYDLFVSINYNSLPLPSVLSNWINRYLSEEFYNTFVDKSGGSGFYWIGNLFLLIMKGAYLIIPIYLIKYKEELMKQHNLWRLCRYFIFFFAIVSFIQCVPVLGERFFWLVRIMAIYIWFKAIYPKHNWVIWLILFSCSWSIFRRYFYHGAVESSVPKEIFYETLPQAICDMLN
ncbi:EpsG family protein [uncultured Duncaniella sp.]|uniref:EpsG family protein n=2 Tax=uncultured Duncaniella sp. TaxID=2768039 RepID=UPI00260A2CC6|nr:EpsG family protein [uncultured Duncaniella sp.]